MDCQEVFDSLEFVETDRFYIRVAPFDIRVTQDADGLEIDVFPADTELGYDPVRSLAVLNSDLTEE